MKTTKYKVLWAEVAETDLFRIVEYIYHDSPGTAINILSRIKEKAQSLELFPNRGRIVPELHDQGIFQYRELIINPWRMIYRVTAEKVYVLSVLDSRQNVEDLLLKRLTTFKR